MRVNESTTITCSKCHLVPYKRHHVPKYHQWMECEELRQLTASERLSLEEEYEMQESWHLDDNKCTFIILERKGDFQDISLDGEISAMIGDVNIFLNNPDNPKEAELEIMIAEPGARGRGVGKEAILAMMSYSIDYVGITEFSTKIGLTNVPSILLFQKLGFVEVSRSEVFQEVTLSLSITPQTKETICERLGDSSITNYTR